MNHFSSYGFWFWTSFCVLSLFMSFLVFISVHYIFGKCNPMTPAQRYALQYLSSTDVVHSFRMEQIVSAIALFFVLLALQYVSIVLRMFVSVPFFLEVFFFLTFIGLLVTFFSCLFRLVHAEKMVARVQKIGLADIVLTGLFTTTFSFSCSIIWSSTTF